MWGPSTWLPAHSPLAKVVSGVRRFRDWSFRSRRVLHGRLSANTSPFSRRRPKLPFKGDLLESAKAFSMATLHIADPDAVLSGSLVALSLLIENRKRSEERRVGKECRSR